MPPNVGDGIEVDATDVGDAIEDVLPDAEEEVHYMKDTISDVEADNDAKVDVIENVQASAMETDPKNTVVAVNDGKNVEKSTTDPYTISTEEVAPTPVQASFSIVQPMRVLEVF